MKKMTTSLHNSHTFLNIFFSIPTIFSCVFSTDNIVLSSTKSFTFSSNQTIVSPGDIFELGIFKPESSSQDTNCWYLGIWFKKISQRTYVWVANRHYPLSSPVGTIQVWESKLFLLDQSNIIVWSTNLTKESNEGSPIVAELLDNGNFVLRYSNIDESHGEFLWQSFDFPIDTLFPGMKLGLERRSKSLISWHNTTDPSRGNFSYRVGDLQAEGIPELYLYSNGKKVYRTSAWNGGFAIGVPRNQPLIYFMFTLTENNEFTYSFQILEDIKKYTSIMRLSTKGYLQYLMWNETSSIWDILWNSPVDECDTYGFCGPNSYCNMQHVCFCMNGFQPKNQTAWGLRNNSDGCVRKSSLSCKSEVEFFQLTNIKLPDGNNAEMNSKIGFDECKQRCVTDCSCTAFTTIKQNGTSNCVIWIRAFGCSTIQHQQYRSWSLCQTR